METMRGTGDVHWNINLRSIGIDPYKFIFRLKTPVGIIVLRKHPLFSAREGDIWKNHTE